jgi:hypothetical protein
LRRYFLFLLVYGSCLVVELHAQRVVEGRVFDAGTGESLPFPGVTYNGLQEGTVGDIEGYFSLVCKEEPLFLEFAYVGYEKQKIRAPFDVQPLQIQLKRADQTLRETVVFPGENPAHRIIRKASKARAQNDPMEMESFSYESYNKLWFTVETDSLSTLDSTGTLDSSKVELKKFFGRNHMFMMESATERQYINGSRDHEEVKASRTSGFENPAFTLLGSQLQSFSFYEDELIILNARYLNPLRKNSTNEYFFLLTDTILLKEAGDTVFQISYRPKDRSRKELLEGHLNIGTDDFALRNATAVYAREDGPSSLATEIRQRYEQVGGHWFPTELMTEIFWNGISINGAVPTGYGQTFIRNIQVDPDLQKGDIPSLELSLDADAFAKEEDYWAKLRKRPLDSTELQTYVVIDSISKEVDLEKRIDRLTNLFRGKFRWGKVDFDLDRVLKYNQPYEGTRLGLGAHTNEHWNRNWVIGGYFGYGSKDKDWKYGADLRFTPKLSGAWSFRLFFDRDLKETAGSSQLMSRKPSFLASGNIRWLGIEQFDRTEAFGFTTEVDLRPNLKLGLSVERQDRVSMASKAILEDADNLGRWAGDVFSLGMSWAPNDRYMAGPNGRTRMGTTYPLMVLDLKFGSSLSGAPDQASGRFQRLEYAFIHRWSNLRSGDLRVEAVFGSTLGSAAPASFVFTPRGNLFQELRESSPLWGTGAGHAFETLFNNEFTSDLQLQFLADYSLPRRILKIDDWSPQIILSQRVLWGQLSDPSVYEGRFLSVTAPEKVFLESGIEFSRMFRSLGIGLYYRYGAYAYDRWTDNLAIKLTAAGFF